MRKLLFAVLGMCAGSTAMAEPTMQQRCEIAEVIAGVVMRSHQAGVPLSETMSGLGKTFPEIVIRAYDETRFQSAQMKAAIEAEFRDRIAVECWKGEFIVPDSVFEED